MDEENLNPCSACGERPGRTTQNLCNQCHWSRAGERAAFKRGHKKCQKCAFEAADKCQLFVVELPEGRAVYCARCARATRSKKRPVPRVMKCATCAYESRLTVEFENVSSEKRVCACCGLLSRANKKAPPVAPAPSLRFDASDDKTTLQVKVSGLDIALQDAYHALRVARAAIEGVLEDARPDFLELREALAVVNGAL